MLIIVMAYPFLPGAQTDTFKGVSVFAGVLFTLGSAGIVGHMMSGLVLVYSRALRPGDYVRVGEVEGIVKEVGTLATKLANFRDEEFTVPNGVMVTQSILNYTRLAKTNGIPLTTTVRIGYNAPWRVVHDLLIAAAAKTSDLRREPAPFVLQRDLSDFCVEYQLVARYDVPERRFRILDELHQHIQDAFNERGIQIMTPHFEGQPEGKVIVPKSKWYGEPAGPAAE
jgi:small-conductance mechanosensitive channel